MSFFQSTEKSNIYKKFNNFPRPSIAYCSNSWKCFFDWISTSIQWLSMYFLKYFLLFLNFFQKIFRWINQGSSRFSVYPITVCFILWQGRKLLCFLAINPHTYISACLEDFICAELSALIGSWKQIKLAV